MANRLANETSLYLRQHADNPVDWFPWGSEVLEKAKAEDKPLLVSVGYSSCHWCHVMAHESFENEYIAKLMNQHFVCVKIDREERPDLDQIYMEAVQMITQQGGWPLNVFCLPDGRPFFGGTYFPPEDRGNGMIPWPQLLMRVHDFFQRDRKKLEENAASILHNLAAMNAPLQTGTETIGQETLTEAAAMICRTHDDDFGGFGQAPKFPPAMTLSLLLELRRGTESEETASATAPEPKRLDEVITTTLAAMAHGGLFDQVGGGFTRYSVDRYWLIPHFEKMLYDNGLLLDIYARAWRRYHRPLFQAVAEETVAWATREMLAPSGLFYVSLDADSEGEEGRFYVWTPDEVKTVLGEERGQAFCAAYHISAEGNFEHGRSNPALVVPEFAERTSFQAERERLLRAREKRIRPGRDEKHLVSWNSLFIRGLAEAAFAFNRPDYFQLASVAAETIWQEARFSGNRLRAVISEGSHLNGYLDDYAFFAEALLSLGAWGDFFEPGCAATWIDRARSLTDSLVQHFADQQEPGFYFTSDDHETLISRRKEWWDNALPAGNSCLLHIFSSLYSITGDAAYQKQFADLKRAYAGYAERAPSGVAHGLAAVAAEMKGIPVIKVKGIQDWQPLANMLRERPWQRMFVLESKAADQPQGYQVCVGSTCRLTTNDLQEVAQQL
jgi:uncharacterized protein